jgi:predicted patatin/cPLA2 family phospholipase
MRCAYSGGALVALGREFNITNPDIVIGISGGAGSLAYYLTGQYDAIETIWTDLLATNDFISLRFSRPILDIDYLIDTVFKIQSPLDIKKLKSTTTDWYFPATDVAIQKQLRFFSKEDSLDIFEILRASMAMPLLYEKKVSLGEFQYQDGDLGLTIEDAIEKARSLDATHIIIIESHLKTFRVRLIDRFFKNKFEASSLMENIPPTTLPPHILKIQNTHSHAGLLTHAKKKLRATFDAGYDDIKNNSDLKSFLSPFIR